MPTDDHRAAEAFWSQLVTLGPRDEASLQIQIRRNFVRAILDGALPAQTRLPSSRTLARQLRVARNTVSAAYQQLADDGLVEAQPRRGYIVNRQDRAACVAADHAPAPAAAAPAAAPDWGGRLGARYQQLRNISKPRDWHRYPYRFIYGQPDPELFPTAEWRECSRAALAVLSIRDWSSDMIDGDDAALIEQLQRRLLPQRGIFANAEQIMITIGSQHALYMLAELLIAPGATVGIEDPGYPDARNMFALRGAALRPLPVAGGGVSPASIAGCELAYLTPSHQCPTSATMSLPNRQALLAEAARHDVLIIEDDYESELAFAGRSSPALKSLDRAGRVIYLASLSKSLAPGLRLGYMVAAPELIREARILRRLMLRHPPANNQRAAALFIALGHHDALVRRMRTNLAERAATLTASLRAHAPMLTFEVPDGGSSVWISGPAGLDARALAAAAARRGILIEPGDLFFHRETAPCGQFRLGYSSIPIDKIEPGIRALAALLS
jgi:GntR family transcriptional regulator/MocR family aminotransferase